MQEPELLGKRCRDIVSGLEGICIGVVEWMYGCRQFVLQPKAEDGMKRTFSSFYFEKQLEVLDDGITDIRIRLAVVPFFPAPVVEHVELLPGFRTRCVLDHSVVI